MRIIVVGATGTIGKSVVAALAGRHEIVKVGHSGGDVQVDLANPASIETMFRAIGDFDAVISAAGAARFGALDDLTDEDYRIGLESKLMGQVNLVLIGKDFVADGVRSRSPPACSIPSRSAWAPRRRW